MNEWNVRGLEAMLDDVRELRRQHPDDHREVIDALVLMNCRTMRALLESIGDMGKGIQKVAEKDIVAVDKLVEISQSFKDRIYYEELRSHVLMLLIPFVASRTTAVDDKFRDEAEKLVVLASTGQKVPK